MLKILIFALIVLPSKNLWASSCGVFRVVKGNVTFQKRSVGKFKKARINKKICAGDTVNASEASRAKIVMSGGNEINVSPKTKFKIEKYVQNKKGKDNKALINVLYGKIRSNVKQKYKNDDQSFYRVKTKSAVAGVRGTEFMVSFDDTKSSSKVVTFEGKVAVGKFDQGKFLGLVNVGPGQFTSNRVGSNPHAARDLPKAELAQYDRATEVSPDSGSSAPASDQNRTPSQSEDSENSESSDGNGSNRTPASEGGAQNDFDNKVDQQLDADGLGPEPDLGFSDPLPKNGIIDPSEFGRAPDLTTSPTIRDQILNRRTKVNIIPCVVGQPNCN